MYPLFEVGLLLSLAGWKLVFPQPFLKWRGREVGGVRGWSWRLRPTPHSLCGGEESRRGEKESTLEWESEVTEFIRSVGSEPWTCLWVSVAVPVHVFSLSSGRPHSPQSLCQSSLIVLGLSSWFRFFCPLQILWLPSDLFCSFSGESLWAGRSSKRGVGGGWLISPSLCLVALFFFSALCWVYLYSMSISRVFFFSPHLVFLQHWDLLKAFSASFYVLCLSRLARAK